LPKPPGKGITVGRLLEEAVITLEKAGVPSPCACAEILIADALNAKRHELPALLETKVSGDLLSRLVETVKRRSEREPLQLILGWAPFLDLKIDIIPGVFVPRPETEGLAELCLALLDGNKTPTIIETCAGTGAVSLWLKSKIPGARVIAIEKYSAPLHCLKTNANSLGYDIEVMRGNLLEPVVRSRMKGEADLVVANPPYISSMEMPLLPPEVIGWESRSALHGGLSGTDFYPAIVNGAAYILRKNGILALEIGEPQGEEIVNKVAKTGLFNEPVIKNDLAGRPRYLYCVRNDLLPRQGGNRTAKRGASSKEALFGAETYG